MPKPLFALGHCVGTPAALEAIARNNILSSQLIDRHVTGDWGDLDAEDKAANDRALAEDSRILSAYVLPDSTKVWIITEADRSSTCVLLPSEY